MVVLVLIFFVLEQPLSELFSFNQHHLTNLMQKSLTVYVLKLNENNSISSNQETAIEFIDEGHGIFGFFIYFC